MCDFDFTGRVVYVAGATSLVGQGVVELFLRHGAKVAISSRSGERLKQFRTDLSEDIKTLGENNLFVFKRDTSFKFGYEDLVADIIKEHKQLHHVICCMGTWWEGGPLTQQTSQEFVEQVQNFAGSPYQLAKAVLPHLDNVTGSTFMFVTNIAGENCFYPEASLVTVGCACLYGVSLAIRAEFQTKTTAVSELRIAAYVTEKQTNSRRASDSHYVSKDRIGQLVLAMTGARNRELQRADTVENVNSLISLFGQRLR